MLNRVTPFQRPKRLADSSALRGAMMILAGCASLTVNDACIKALLETHPVGQVVSIRAAIGVAFLVLLSQLFGGPRALAPRSSAGSAILTGLLIVGLFLFPLSLKFVSLADAIMLAYLSPVIVAILSPFVLGEQVGWRRWGAVAVGLLGAALVIRPEGGELQAGMLIPVVVAVTIAARDILARRFIQGENAFALVATAHLGAALIGLFSLTAGWTPLTALEWALLLTAAITLTLAQILLVSAFRYADATMLSCLKYTSIIWAAAFGWIFFQEAPEPMDWVGAALIALSGVIIMTRTKKRAAEAPRRAE